MVWCQWQIGLGHSWCCPVWLPLCAVINWGAVRLAPLWPNWPFQSDHGPCPVLGSEHRICSWRPHSFTACTRFSSPRAVEFHPNKPSFCHCPHSPLLATLPLQVLLHIREKNAHVEGTPVWGWHSPTADECGITNQWIRAAERHEAIFCQANVAELCDTVLCDRAAAACSELAQVSNLVLSMVKTSQINSLAASSNTGVF